MAHNHRATMIKKKKKTYPEADLCQQLKGLAIHRITKP